MILVTKVTSAGEPFQMVVNSNNFIEASADGASSWFKYWDGEKVRSCKVQETPEEIYNQN